MVASMEGLRLGAPKISAFEHPLFTKCPSRNEVTPIMVLMDDSGRRVGLLRLMNDEKDYDNLNQVELVVISKGSCTVRDIVECFEQQAFNERLEWPGSSLTMYFSTSWLHRSLRPLQECDEYTMPSSLRRGSVDYHIDDTCHFYNVLWVERKDGIAYRRACGRILAPIWEQYLPEEIEITLG